MAVFKVEGGHRLRGEITPQGAKNEALQILCATVLTREKVTVHNIPRILDVMQLIELLRRIGVEVEQLSETSYSFRAADINLDYFKTEDTILYTSDEFGFWEISDAYSTGSSIMPQKKNPDIPELIRGKCGRVIGDLTGFLATLKALPLAYDKDLQEDKEALFDAEKTVFDCVTVFHAMFKEMKFNSGAMFRAAEGGFSTATDVADYLSKKGVPFRDAHAITGKLVRYCIEHEKTLRDLSLKEFKAVSDVFERDVTGVVLARTSAESRDSVGGSSQLAARKALIRIRNRLKHYN